ncbi:MAG: hypothetical protein ACXWW6_01440, partial [Candidatus Limnocylindrales bacterium]
IRGVEMQTTTNGRSIVDGLETMGREGLQAGREGLQSLGREGLQAGREGLHALGSSVADLAETLPLRPKRRRSFPLVQIIAVALVGAVVVALVSRLMARRDGLGPHALRSKAERRIDHDAVSRAADEGMGTAIGASVTDDLIARSEDPDARPDYTVLTQAAGA